MSMLPDIQDVINFTLSVFGQLRMYNYILCHFLLKFLLIAK